MKNTLTISKKYAIIKFSQAKRLNLTELCAKLKVKSKGMYAQNALLRQRRGENIMDLYSSRKFALTEIHKSGKKQTLGILDFKGVGSKNEDSFEVVALESGKVTAAGRCNSLTSRLHRLGTYVIISGKDGVSVTYSRLSKRYVSVGEYVEKGQPIGIEGDTGSGQGVFLRLEFRKNGRLIDGCAYLGITPEKQKFDNITSSPAEIVCRVCNLPPDVRQVIDNTPHSDYIWQQLLSNLRIR